MLATSNRGNFEVSVQLPRVQFRPGAEAGAGGGQGTVKVTDEYQSQYEVAETALRQISQQHDANQREKLVAQIALRQNEIASQANTVRSTGRAGIESQTSLLNQTLSLLAGGAAISGPIGAVLADIGCRQMDSLRAQNLHSTRMLGTGGLDDTRDANVSGRAMLEAIELHAQDSQAQAIASEALGKLGDRYQHSEHFGGVIGLHRSGKDVELYRDSSILYGAFNDIKNVTCQGDRHNPKCMAFLAGDAGSISPTSVNRPGGWIGHSGPADAFSVQEKREHPLVRYPER